MAIQGLANSVAERIFFEGRLGAGVEEVDFDPIVDTLEIAVLIAVHVGGGVVVAGGGA